MVSNTARVGETPPAFWRFLVQLRRQPIAFVATVIVLVYVFLGVFGGMIAPHGYETVQDDPDRCLTRPDGSMRCAALQNAAPSTDYRFGTDRNGRDVFSRILHGARVTIGLPIVATLLAVAVGALLGLLAGYLGGWVDELLSRAFDALLAIPALVLALVMLSTIVPALQMSDNPFVKAIGAVNIALVQVIVLLYTPIVARVVRSVTLTARDKGYVEIARLRGERVLYILLNEILPSVLPALAVEGALRFSYAIFLVASLGFLGLGAQPPVPEWGRMVLDARATSAVAPWALWFPVGAIAVLIISVNLMADGLQRTLRNDDGRT